MASFVASPASRTARAARYGAPRHVSLIGHTRDIKGNNILEADVTALKNATLAEAGPILLRLLQSVKFREYASVNGIIPAGVPDCIYTYMYNGVLIVDTPTRPTSPESVSFNSPSKMFGSNWMERERPEGPDSPEGSSPVSTQSTLYGNSEGSFGLEMDILAYLKGLATSESTCKVSDPSMLFAQERKFSSSSK